MPSRTSPIRWAIQASTVASRKSRQPILGTPAFIREAHNHRRWCLKPRPPPRLRPNNILQLQTDRCVCAPTNREVEASATRDPLAKEYSSATSGALRVYLY